MSPRVNLIGGLIPPWTPGKCSCGGRWRRGNERLGLRLEEGRGLMFNMETSRRAQQPWRECTRWGWMTRNLSPPRGPQRVPSAPEHDQGQTLSCRLTSSPQPRGQACLSLEMRLGEGKRPIQSDSQAGAQAHPAVSLGSRPLR